MSRFDLQRFTAPDALARAVATEWLDQLPTAIGRTPHYCVALDGGRIAGQFFKAVADLGRSQSALLQQVHFFWGDERCVPPDDKESNFKLANDNMLSPLGVPAKHIHRLRGEDPPEISAVAAERELKQFASSDAGGQPVFDLVFLGMGPEGHTASLFPGEPKEVMDSPAVYRPVTVPKPPPRRVTLGYAALAAARQVWVLVSGEGKENALKESLAPDGRTPLARVLQRRDRSRVYTDLLPS